MNPRDIPRKAPTTEQVLEWRRARARGEMRHYPGSLVALATEVTFVTGPPCARCKRPDCGLSQPVIVGMRTYVKAALDCYQAQRAAEAQ